MNLSLKTSLADGYTNNSQIIRVLTEYWVTKHIYCPHCGQIAIDKYPNNKPAADFVCSNCREDYELKSKKQAVGNRVADGAYQTMMERLKSSHNPNLFLLRYDLQNYQVLDFLVIPKHFFVPEMIEKRKALSSTARRVGWTGCNILLQSLPQTGKIFLIRNQEVEPKEKVLAEWQKTLFLREEKEPDSKGWLLDVMSCIESLGSQEFSLNEIYTFESTLEKRHPRNKHVKDKIRQQLQVLRDKGYLEFIERGRYRLPQD